MSTNVNEVGGPLPRCRRIVMVGQAKRDIASRQQSKDDRLVPARMPKLETVTAPPGKKFEKLCKSFGICFEVRRQLKQNRARLVAQQRQSLLDEDQAVGGILGKAFPVGDEFGSLPCEDEIISRLRPPAFHGLEARRSIEHTIELGGPELPRIVFKLFLERQSLWEKRT